MKKLIYIIIGIILTACSDDIYTSSESSAEGHAMRFEVTVIDQPQTRGEVIDVTDNEITRDFKKGDSFGLFIITLLLCVWSHASPYWCSSSFRHTQVGSACPYIGDRFVSIPSG